MRRLPKRGFSNYPFKKEFQIININNIEGLKLKIIDKEILLQKRLIKSIRKPVKLLGNGKLSSKVEVKLEEFSKTAQDKIEKLGGKIIKI